MVQDQGIEVYLAPYNDISRRYPEHAIPTTSPAFTGKPNEVYIEAVDGERFMIVVKVLEEFDTKGGNGFLLGRITSGEWQFSPNCLPVLSEVPRKTHIFPLHTSISSETKKIDGRWVESGFRFAQLKMDEEMDMDEDQVANGIEVHGRVDVAIYRGESIPSSTARSNTPATRYRSYHLSGTQLSSNAVVKKNHVSHTIESVVLKDSAQPIYGDTSWQCLPAPAGNPIKFTIRYRSRDALQKLKIIPRDQMLIDLTDSPPSSPKVKRERGAGSVGCKRAETHHCKRSVTQHVTDRDSSDNTSTMLPAVADKSASIDASKTREQQDRKRKAIQELREVELEVKQLALAQKRLRLEKELAEMEGNGS